MNTTIRDAYPKRLSMTLTPDQMSRLKQARVNDDVQSTYRIRAMIDLYFGNPEFRMRVDTIAYQAQKNDDAFFPLVKRNVEEEL